MEFIYKAVYYLAKLVGFYSTLLVLRIMLTWLPSVNGDGPVVSFFKKICDPYLDIFKGNKTQIGRFDFSPILALMVLNVVQSILTMFATYGQITVGIILAIIINGLWHYLFSYFLIILLVLIGIRWFAGRSNSPRSIAFVNSVESILYKPVHFVYNIFYKGKNMNDQTIVLTAFFFYLISFIGLRYGINLLIKFLCTV